MLGHPRGVIGCGLFIPDCGYRADDHGAHKHLQHWTKVGRKTANEPLVFQKEIVNGLFRRSVNREKRTRYGERRLQPCAKCEVYPVVVFGCKVNGGKRAPVKTRAEVTGKLGEGITMPLGLQQCAVFDATNLTDAAVRGGYESPGIAGQGPCARFQRAGKKIIEGCEFFQGDGFCFIQVDIVDTRESANGRPFPPPG